MAWSENYKYKNPDITGLVDNVKKMMGVDSGAGGRRSRNMSDYLTTSKTEGQQLKNTQQSMLVEAMKAALGQEGLSDDGRLLRAATTSSTDIGGGLSKEAMLASQIAEQEGKAQLQKQAVDKGNLIASLAKRLEVGGSPEHAKRVFTGPQGRPGISNVTVPARGYSEGDQERWARLIRTLQGGQVGTDMDYSGARGKSETTGKVGLFEARTTAAKNLGVANVELANERTAEVLARTGNAGKLNAEKIKEIQDRVLINWNQGFQQATTAKKRRELLDQTIKTEIQKTLGAKETVKKKVAETSIAQKEDEAKGGELYLDKRALEVKLDTLKQKLLKETDNAKIAALNQKHAETLKLLEVETARAGKGKAVAQKEKAVNLASMSKKELDALDPKIKAQAEELQVKIRKGEQQIELAKARTDDVNMARNVKILQKANMNNKNALQQLLSPHLQKYAEERATNEAEKFANQMKLKMIPKPAPLKAPADKGGIGNFWPEFLGGDEDVPDMPGEAHDEMYGDIMELAETGKLDKLDVKNAQGITPRTQILKSMIQKLGLTKDQATQKLEQWVEELLPAPPGE
jgi:hypothetical protein